VLDSELGNDCWSFDTITYTQALLIEVFMLRAPLLSLIAMLLPLTSGCGGGVNSPAAAARIPSKARMFKGALHSGQSPICSSTIGIYVAGDVAPCAVANTDTQGNFGIDLSDPCNDCSFAPPDKQMYIVASGGVANNNNCAAGGDNNTAVAMSA